MLESLSTARGKVGILLSGMIAGGGAVLLLGAPVFWAMVVLALAVLLVGGFVTFQEPISRVPEQHPDDPLDILPPLTRLVLDRLPTPVMLLDGSERVLFVNQSMREVLGPGLERKKIGQVLRHPDVLAAVADANAAGAAANVPLTLPVPVERHFQVHVARVQVAPSITALLLHDVTVVRRSEQMRADFVANASHELRTPLAAVSGFIDTLRGHARDDAVAREQFLDIMAGETARMRRLIHDLLSLARIEMNEHVRPEGRIALEGVVRQAAQVLMPLAAQDGVRIAVEGPPHLPEVLGDRDELVQLFQNLIHNAIKYGRAGGTVTVTLAAEGGEVSAAVRDQGEGIDPAAIPRLTERFYRVDVKRSRERGGTGLGLAIVKHIVNRHQGRLAIESIKGMGSTFTVHLPQAPDSSARLPPGDALPAEVAGTGAAPVTEML
jgi:two-component system phosphate regulon sensor histidine kinase PhoR